MTETETEQESGAEELEELEGAEGNGAPDEDTQELELPTEGATPEVWERRFKRLEKPHAVYVAAVGAILEEDANDLLPCPLCAGGIPAFVSAQGAGRQSDEVKLATETYLGVVQEADYPPDPEYAECDLCKGTGSLRKPTKVRQYRLAPCRKCMGSGHLPPPGVTVGAPSAVPLGATPAALPESYAPEPEADPFGHPRLMADGMPNPNYGKMPAFVDPRFP